MHNELVMLSNVIASNTHIPFHCFVCAVMPNHEGANWYGSSSLTSESVCALIIVVCVDLIHSMWVCDAVCQSFHAAIRG